MTTEKNPIDYACATTDEPEAQFRLSEFYKEEASKLDYQTDNFHLDYHELTKQSFYWCVKAAQQGHLEALDTLGWYCESGFGVERDHSQAFTMYLEAAEAGHAKAQFHLAKMLASGRGADYDPDEAVRWAKKAAKELAPWRRRNIRWSPTPHLHHGWCRWRLQGDLAVACRHVNANHSQMRNNPVGIRGKLSCRLAGPRAAGAARP